MKIFFTITWFFFLATALNAQDVKAPLVKEQPNNNQESAKPLSNSEVNEATSSSSVSSSSVTKIQVEGASFRNFRAYLQFAPLKKLDPKEKIVFDEIKSIIQHDFELVSGFDFTKVDESKELNDAFLKASGVEGKAQIVIGFDKNNILITSKNTNFVAGKVYDHNLKADQKAIRKLAHNVSKNLYENFIGPEDIFLRQLAAIKTTGNNEQQIVLMDFDGKNERVITSDKWVKVSPYFSPDGKNLLYGVVTPTGHGIVEHNLTTGKKVFLTKKNGINMEPRITQDNKCLFMTLSYEKEANIYRAERNGRILGHLTESLGANLSPSISGDGKKLAFVSTRSQNPQIYVQDLSNCQLTGSAKRVTFQGNYNQTPSFNTDGSIIAFTGRDEKNAFDIFLANPAADKIARVTQGQGNSKSPYFLPSGRSLLFVSKRDGQKGFEIFLSNLSGNHQRKITAGGDYDSVVVNPVL